MTRSELLASAEQESAALGYLYDVVRRAGWTGWHPGDYDPTDADLIRLIFLVQEDARNALAKQINMSRDIMCEVHACVLGGCDLWNYAFGRSAPRCRECQEHASSGCAGAGHQAPRDETKED